MPIPRTILARDGVPDLDLAVVGGTWPADLDGEIFISTSDMATAPKHAFFGDGVMIRLSLRPGTHDAPAERFAWRAKVLDTPARRLRILRPDVFKAGALGVMSPFGYVNSANTAPLPWGDRLFATWDAGRPVEVDPVDLSWVADVGHRDDWAPAIDHPLFPLIASTAHPVIDPDRNCLWTVSLNPIDARVQIIRWDGSGAHVDRWPVTEGSVPQSMHTITQTRDWLILADTAFRADPDEILGVGPRSIAPLASEPVYLVRKDTLETTPPGQPVPATAFRVAPEVMHYYAVYDDSDGIRLIFEHTPLTDLAYYVQDDDLDATGSPVDPALRGMYNHPMAAARVSILDFDPDTGAAESTVVHLDEPGARGLAARLTDADFTVAPTGDPSQL
ncbi:MAG: carotenoid oxygenase family protein [Acidimicrobiales bacterium]